VVVYNGAMPNRHVVRPINRESLPPDGSLEEVARIAGSPLLAHLQSVAGNEGVAKIIQLLHDLRAHQHHEKVKEVHGREQHRLVEAVNDHSSDVLQLLVDDYLKTNNLEDRGSDAHRQGLESHLVETLAASLQGYMGVVDEIRGEVSEMAERISADASVENLRKRILELHEARRHDHVQRLVQELPPESPIHHIFNGVSDDLDQAIAIAVYRHKGVVEHEEALDFIHGDFAEALDEHYEASMGQLKKGGQFESGVTLRETALDEIIERRLMDPKINAAFSLMEALQIENEGKGARLVLQQLKRRQEEGDTFSDYLLRVMADPSAINVAALNQRDKPQLAFGQLNERVGKMGRLYLRSLIVSDESLRNSISIISHKRELRKNGEEFVDVLSNVPAECKALRKLITENKDVIDGIVDYWCEETDGSHVELAKILQEITADASLFL